MNEEPNFYRVWHWRFPNGKPWEDDSPRSGSGKYNLIWNEDQGVWGVFLNDSDIRDFVATAGMRQEVKIAAPTDIFPLWTMIVTDSTRWGQR